MAAAVECVDVDAEGDVGGRRVADRHRRRDAFPSGPRRLDGVLVVRSCARPRDARAAAPENGAHLLAIDATLRPLDGVRAGQHTHTQRASTRGDRAPPAQWTSTAR